MNFKFNYKSPINECNLVHFLWQNWHKACFHCDVCKMVLTANNFVSHKKRPYCSVWVPQNPRNCTKTYIHGASFGVRINFPCVFQEIGVKTMSIFVSHPSRHNPRNNTFTSVYETPVNINAKKQSKASSEVRRCKNTQAATRDQVFGLDPSRGALATGWHKPPSMPWATWPFITGLVMTGFTMEVAIHSGHCVGLDHL